MIHILIADDSSFIRQIFNIYFKTESDIEVVGTCKNGKIALQLVEKLIPDIVLMDMEMPEMDGLTATKLIRHRFPRTKVIINSGYNSQDYINRALNAGANGYFVKNMPGKEFLAAIRLIHQQQNVRIVPAPAFSDDKLYVVVEDSLSNLSYLRDSSQIILDSKRAKITILDYLLFLYLERLKRKPFQ